MMHPLLLSHQTMTAGPASAQPYHALQTHGSAWSRWTGYGDLAVQSAREACTVFASLGKPEELRILCAGCGDGLEMDVFQRVGFQVVGFDLDAEKVRVAQYCGLRAKVGDMHDPPYTEGIYDGVFCSHTLEHALDRGRAAQGLIGLLRAGGLCFVVAPLEPTYPLHNPSHTGWIGSPAALVGLFQGVEVVTGRVVNNPDPQAVIVLRKT